MTGALRNISFFVLLLTFLFCVDVKAQNTLFNDAPKDLEVLDEEDLSNIPNATQAQVFEQRLQKIEGRIPLDFNEHVEKYILHFTGSRKQHFQKILARSQKYFPVFEKVLKEEGMPDELKYLAVVESSLNPYAVSPRGATGPWQFMLSTGLKYDLEVNKRVDERKDPYESTVAAASFLRYLYNYFGDWLLAIAAYNCGPGGVLKAMKKAGGAGDYWAIRPYLPKETQGYVPSFIATVYTMKYAKSHGIVPAPLELLEVERVQINRKVLLTDLEKTLKVPREIIIQENPSLLTTLVPEGFLLNLPAAKIAAFNAIQDSLYALSENATYGERLITPVVVKLSSSPKEIPETVSQEDLGRTSTPVLSGSAVTTKKNQVEKPRPAPLPEPKEEKGFFEKLFSKKDSKKDKKIGVKEADVAQKKKTNEKKSQPEKVIKEVAKDSLPKRRVEDKSDDSDYKVLVYAVKKGDNPGFIAHWFHCSLKELRSWNDLNSNNLQIGQELLIYVHKDDWNKFNRFNKLSLRLKEKLCSGVKTHEEFQQEREKEIGKMAVADSTSVVQQAQAPKLASKAICFEEYAIKKGNTLWDISKKYKISVDELRKLNEMKPGAKLKPGQKIKIRRKENC